MSPDFCFELVAGEPCNFSANGYAPFTALAGSAGGGQLAYVRIRHTIHEGTPTGIGDSEYGGVLSTMIDMAAVPAVFTGKPAGTADLQITYSATDRVLYALRTTGQ